MIGWGKKKKVYVVLADNDAVPTTWHPEKIFMDGIYRFLLQTSASACSVAIHLLVLDMRLI